jgi:hypothetical protein
MAVAERMSESSSPLGRAMVVAGQYARLVQRGETSLAHQALRTIHELVGKFEGSVLMLPACVVDECRGGHWIVRIGFVPASEVQS